MRFFGILFGVILVMILVSASACGSGSSSSSSSPTSPTPSNPATPVSQNGCSATFACPSTDSSGVANPSTPTFDRLTISNGTSSACRAPLPRNSPDPGIPIEFTIRNPRSGFSWRFHPDSSLMTISPSSGSAGTAGAFQAIVKFNPANLSLSSGLNFTQNLTLDLVDTLSPFQGSTPQGNVVAACGVTLWATVPAGQ